MRRILQTALVILALAGGNWAVAQDGARPPGRRGDRDEGSRMRSREAMLQRILHNPEVARQIGLTEDQVNTLKTEMFKAREKEIKLRAEMELIGLEQAKLMMKDDVDEDAVMKSVEKKWEIKAELAKIPIRAMLLVKKTLTPEQRAKIETVVRARARERRGERREGEGDRRPRFGERGDQPPPEEDAQ